MGVAGDCLVSFNANIVALAPANGVDLRFQPVVVAFFRSVDAHQPPHHRVDTVLLPEHRYGLVGLLRLPPEHIRGHRLLCVLSAAHGHDALPVQGRPPKTAWGHCSPSWGRAEPPGSYRTARAARGHRSPTTGAKLDLCLRLIAVGANGVLICVIDMAVGALCVAHRFSSSVMYSFAGTLQR